MAKEKQVNLGEGVEVTEETREELTNGRGEDE